jgi:hypothetical protein
MWFNRKLGINCIKSVNSFSKKKWEGGVSEGVDLGTANRDTKLLSALK